MNIDVNDWISIDDRLSPMVSKKSSDGDMDYLESDYVLVWDGHKVDIAQAVSDRAGRYWVDRYADIIEVVCWMPLPPPPSQRR